MPLVPVTQRTRFECTNCGKCCKGYILSKKQNLTITSDEGPRCKNLTEKNMCSIYENPQRPFICHMFPFYPDIEKIKRLRAQGKPPSGIFSPENLLIHTECEGYGVGKRVVANTQLLKALKRNEQIFLQRVMQGITTNESYEELF